MFLDLLYPLVLVLLHDASSPNFHTRQNASIKLEALGQHYDTRASLRRFLSDRSDLERQTRAKIAYEKACQSAVARLMRRLENEPVTFLPGAHFFLECNNASCVVHNPYNKRLIQMLEAIENCNLIYCTGGDWYINWHPASNGRAEAFVWLHHLAEMGYSEADMYKQIQDASKRQAEWKANNPYYHGES